MMAMTGSRRTMDCDYCQVEMSERQASMAQPYPYAISGLKDVFLVGIVVRECAKCGAVAPVIPRIAELHDVIARTLVKEPRPLRGDEIRFLRKAAALPARKFASLLGITPQHLSRIENGHTLKLGKAADRLARFIAIKARDGENIRELFLQIADRLEAEQKESEVSSCFELKRGSGWKEAA
jgi:transcriptional regulator with XRE-family HTH domain